MYHVNNIVELILYLDRFAWAVSKPVRVDQFHAIYLASVLALLLDPESDPESVEVAELFRNAALDAMSDRFAQAQVTEAHMRFFEELMLIGSTESVSRPRAILMLIDAVGSENWLVSKTRKGKLRVQMKSDLAELLNVKFDVKMRNPETAKQVEYTFQ